MGTYGHVLSYQALNAASKDLGVGEAYPMLKAPE
jgi:hypothetical protein